MMKRSLLLFATVLFMTLLGTLYIPKAFAESDIIVTIPPGSNPKKIAKILKAAQLIRSEKAFVTYTKVWRLDRKLRSGTFKLSPNTRMTEIAKTLTEANGAAILVKVTVPEGYSTRKIARLLESKKLANADAFYDFVATKAKQKLKHKYTFLSLIPTQNLEGYLFPETYAFGPSVDMLTIVDKMLEQFEKNMMPIWNAAPKAKQSPKSRFNFHKIVTMASLIEKEATLKKEMPLISSVFYNRLQKYMKLASDPTVLYALGEPKNKKIVYYKDLKVDSPYNTYKHAGFPPGPIASPGTEALTAAVAPDKSDYLFFVADRNGAHLFTRTYKEHLAVQKTLK